MRKGLAIFLIMVLLSVTISGCGILEKIQDVAGKIIQENLNPEDEPTEDPEDPGDPGDEPSDDPGDEPVDEPGDDPGNGPLFSETVFFPWLSEEIYERFQEFGYIWTFVYEDGQVSDWAMYYKVEGQENVGGIDAEHVSVTHTEYDETNEYEYWFDADMNCLKVTVNGAETAPEDAPTIAVLLSNYANAVGLASGVIFEDATYDAENYSLEDQRAESMDLNGESVSMEVYEFLQASDNITSTYGLTKIGDELVYIYFKHYNNDTTAYELLNVTHAVNR